MDQNIGKVIADRYRLEEVVHAGGTSVLYAGVNLVVDRPALVRVLETVHSDLKQGFLEEARSVSHIDEPSILSVSDFGSDADGTAYTVYEPFDCESLAAHMERGEKMDPALAVDIVRQFASALTAVYSDRPVHGGYGPDNVLISTTDGEPMLVKIYDLFPADKSGLKTSAGGENYLGPELSEENSEADARSDVYSLGALLYRMLAGETPYANDRDESRADGPPPPLASFRNDLPAGLEAVMLKAMSKDPEMRQADPAEFAAELGAEGLAGRQISASEGTNLWKTAFVVLAGITLLAAALIYGTSVKRTDPVTRLQPDANGQPVQPINPATGLQEQSLSNMQGMSETLSNANITPPGTLPGGDGFDAWKNGGVPPPGAPTIGPGGQVVTIDPNNPSQFMPLDGGCIMQPSGILLCPAPPNANTGKKPTPTPKPSTANANVQASPTPKGTPETKPSPAAEKTPPKNPAANVRPAREKKPGEPE